MKMLRGIIGTQNNVENIISNTFNHTRRNLVEVWRAKSNILAERRTFLGQDVKPE
jgi:hypothetical protein